MVFDSSDISSFHFLEGCVGHFIFPSTGLISTATRGLRTFGASAIPEIHLEGVEGFRKTCAKGWIRLVQFWRYCLFWIPSRRTEAEPGRFSTSRCCSA